MKYLRSLYDWMGKTVHGSYAIFWLAFFFFIESCIFPVPVDPLLILFCLKDRLHSFWYATIATSASVIGGLFGYLMGAALWEIVGPWFLRFIITPAIFERVTDYYRLYQAWAVLIAAFTPIPYKAVTLSAGFCHLPLVPFIFYSIIGRGARFFLEALLLRYWGEQIGGFIDRYFDRLIIAFSVLLLASVYLLRLA